MPNIFVSWSKAKSREFALEIKYLIESLDPHSNVFMSEENISAGEKVQEKIIKKIEDCDLLLLCFTKENKKSPWLLYEAGFACGLNKTVIPLLFDNDPNWHSWIDNPMNVVREINIDGADFEASFINCFGLRDSSYTRNVLSNFIKNVENIKDKYRQVDIQCEDFVDILLNNESFKVKSPIYRNKTAYFMTGFETFDLWKAVVQSFLYTGKYLWIYGRKNMKLFGGNFKELFEYLEEKGYNEKYQIIYMVSEKKNFRSRHYKNVKFVLISPPELRVPSYIRDEVLKGFEFKEVTNLDDVLPELDILYMTRVQKERFFNEEDYIRMKDCYILTKEKMDLAKDDMLVLHPLPRVNEISVEVDNDPRAAYFKQVQFGVYVRMALILTLLGLAPEKI